MNPAEGDSAAPWTKPSSTRTPEWRKRMRVVAGALALVPGVLYLGQVVSVVDLGLAQRLGLQENPERVDPLFTRLEVWTARWDLVWLWTLPVAGVLMIGDHGWWPFVALIGGSAGVDTGGRELAKWLGLRGHGVGIGGPSDRRIFVGGLLVIGIIGLLVGLTGFVEAV